MRVLVAVALLLAAEAVAGFENGKEYVYNYEGKIQTINLDQPLQSNGLAFRSKIALQPKGDLTLFKVSDFVVDLFHGETINLKTHTFNFQPHEQLTNYLERPFAAAFKEGRVQHAELGKDEPLWSHNIKKAIISLFQLDLSKRSQINPLGNEFVVTEDGLHGQCQTTYVVSEEDEGLEVTKIKDLEKCNHQAYHFTGTLKGRPCTSCKSQRWLPLTMTSEVKYRLKGTRERYVIGCACGSSDQVLAPYGDGKKFHVQVNNTATLVEERDSAAEISLPEVESHQRLSHSFPKAEDAVTGLELQAPNHYVREFGLSGSKETFIEGLKRLAAIEYSEEDYKNMRDKPSGGMLFLQLFSNMLTLTYDEISEIYNQHILNAPNGAKKYIRGAFLDLLVAAGNNPHISFALKLINAGQLSTDEADRLLLKFPNNLKEFSVAVVSELANLCHSEFVSASESLRSTCVLAVSALAGGARCNRATNLLEADSGLCSPHIVELFFNYSLMPEDVKAKSEQRIIYYINAAGNLATSSAVRYLQRFADPRHNQSVTRRSAALWALTRTAALNPSLVRSIVLPIYENTSEPHVVRAAAFINIIFSNPDLYILRHIARSLIDDPSDNLVSFVSSSFRAIANSKFPCVQDLVEKLRHVLPLWANVRRLSKPVDITNSVTYASSGYSREYDIGSLSVLSVLRSEDSFLPQSIYAATQAYAAGNVYEVFALSFEQWGLDRLVNALLGPRPGSTKTLWNVLSRPRFTRSTSETNRKHIEQALPIADREYEPMNARLNVQLFGHTVKLMQFDESTLAAFQSNEPPAAALAHVLGENVHSKDFHLVEDLIVLVPTEVGFPTYFDIKTADFTYGNRAKFDFEHTEDGKFVVDFKKHFVHETRSYKMLGIALTFNRTSLGSGYDSRQLFSLPLELQLTLDPVNHKLNVKRPVSPPVDLFSYHFVPFTFQLPYDRSTIEEPKALPGYPLYNNEDLYLFDRTYLNGSLGVSVNFQGYALKKDLNANLREFFHGMDLREKIEYLVVNPRWSPRAFRMQVLPAEHDPLSVVELDLSHHFYKPEDTERQTQFGLEDLPAAGSERPYTHAVLGRLAFRGGQRERKLSWELRYSFSKDLFRHKLLFHYDRQPFSPSEHSHTKICLEASAKFPRPDHTKLGEIAAFHQGKEIQAFMKLYYGSNCVDDSSIYFNGKYTHTDEDAKDIQANAAGAPLASKRLSSLRELYAKCLKDKEHGIPLSHHCVYYLYRSSRLGKLVLDVQYKNPKPLLPTLLRQYLAYSRPHKAKPGFLSIIFSHMTGPSGELHVESQVPASAKKPHADVVVTDQSGHSRHYDHVPIRTHLLEPRVFIAFRYSNLAEYSPYYRHRYCDVQGQSARAFNGVIVDLPKTDCYKVVARDCSVNRRFVVLARALSNSAFSKALKVFIHNTEIELLPAGDGHQVVVKVDGAAVAVTDDKAYAHTLEGAELFTVSKTHGMYEILSKSYGLDVFLSSQVLFVQVAPFYRGKLCGLCGDYNYDRQHELVGSNLHRYKDTLSFAKSYVVPSGDCTPP
ncbi:vitellogenin-6-like [Dermacentor andersoni]|uniref:vitellogenin-6-like n=1 Tax=Dermacentor andersoni TaxID=34620 RepID=UPI0021556DFC|nr:vitellogenin-6-like [Dermacentor andersoni]